MPPETLKAALSAAESLAGIPAITGPEPDEQARELIVWGNGILKALTDERKGITARLDAMKAELMQPEKQLAAAIETAKARRNEYAAATLAVANYKAALADITTSLCAKLNALMGQAESPQAFRTLVTMKVKGDQFTSAADKLLAEKFGTFQQSHPAHFREMQEMINEMLLFYRREIQAVQARWSAAGYQPKRDSQAVQATVAADLAAENVAVKSEAAPQKNILKTYTGTVVPGAKSAYIALLNYYLSHGGSPEKLQFLADFAARNGCPPVEGVTYHETVKVRNA